MNHAVNHTLLRFSEPDAIPVFSTCVLFRVKNALPYTQNHHINHLSPRHPNPHTFPLCGGVKIVFELLHHWIEQFSSLQLVFAGPAPAATGGCGMKQADVGGQRFAQLRVEMFYLTSLERLQLRDLLHVSSEKVQRKNRQTLTGC